jgi:hypothetical protein
MHSCLRLLPILILSPHSLFAQDSTTQSADTPFRRGQWAAQFSAGSGASLGFLKFRSDRRALLLEVRLAGAHGESIVTDTTGSRFAGLSSAASVQLRFGRRRYRGGTPKVATHYTIGALAGFDHDVSRSPVSAAEANTWTVGLFGDIGATYLVTSRLGLGALAGASLSYSSSKAELQPSNVKFRDWQIGGSAVSGSLVATLFF